MSRYYFEHYIGSWFICPSCRSLCKPYHTNQEEHKHLMRHNIDLPLAKIVKLNFVVSFGAYPMAISDKQILNSYFLKGVRLHNHGAIVFRFLLERFHWTHTLKVVVWRFRPLDILLRFTPFLRLPGIRSRLI